MAGVPYQSLHFFCLSILIHSACGLLGRSSFFLEIGICILWDMFVYNSRRSHCISRALGISFASPRNNSFLSLSWCLSTQIVGLYFSFYVYVFWRCFLYSYYTVSTLKLFKSCSSFGAKTYWKRRIERYFNLFDTFFAYDCIVYS